MAKKENGVASTEVKKSNSIVLESIYSGEFKVEKGIPIPGFYKGKPYEPPFPWLKMKPGDSFFIKANGVPIDKMKRVMHAALSYMKKSKDYKDKAAGYKQAIREEKGGIRVWRVK